MALWVWALLAVVCAAGAVAEPASWTRSHGGRERRLGSVRRRLDGHRTRLGGHRWRSRRPSVPEMPDSDEREDLAVQMQRWWNQWMNGTQSDQPQPKLPAFVLKEQLSSRDGVNRLRKLGPTRAFHNFDIMNDAGVGLYNAKDMHQMVQLFTEIQVNHSCREPARRLVRVSDVYPSTSAVYVPPSVLLRRCSDGTGCCSFDYQTCASAASATVKLPVLVNHVAGTMENGIKHLSFVEDTECKCMKKTEANYRASNECPRNLPVNDSGTVGPRMGKGRRRKSRKNKSTKQECQCTSEFASRPMPKGRCKCDCFDSNRKCKRQRRGAAHLSEADNRCIVRGTCKPPDCKHGRYEKTRGRCPRKRGEWRPERFIV